MKETMSRLRAPGTGPIKSRVDVETGLAASILESQASSFEGQQIQPANDQHDRLSSAEGFVVA